MVLDGIDVEMFLGGSSDVVGHWLCCARFRLDLERRDNFVC